MTGQVVPDDHQALDHKSEGHGAFDGGSGVVAGFPDTGDLFGVGEGDLDGPPRGVAFDDLLGGRGRIGGDQGQIATAGFADDDDPYGTGAEHTARPGSCSWMSTVLVRP